MTHVYKHYILCCSFGSLLLVSIGADSSQELSYSAQLLYWFIHISVGLVIFNYLCFIVSMASPISPELGFVIGSSAGAVVFSFVSIALEMPFGIFDALRSNLLAEIANPAFQSLLFWLLINIPLLQDQLKTPVIRSNGGLADYLEKRFQQYPSHIRAEGNYIKLVFEDNYSTLILYTLARASEELEDFMRIHRSYLVNKKHIQERKNINNSPHVVLKNGITLKVGRTYTKALSDFLRVSHSK